MILCIYREHDADEKGKAINRFKAATDHLLDKDLVDGHWSAIEVTQYLYGLIHHYGNNRKMLMASISHDKLKALVSTR